MVFEIENMISKINKEIKLKFNIMIYMITMLTYACDRISSYKYQHISHNALVIHL